MNKHQAVLGLHRLARSLKHAIDAKYSVTYLPRKATALSSRQIGWLSGEGGV